MEQTIAQFCNWLAETPFSLLLQTVSWIIPAVQSVHIMAITVVVGAVLMIDMKLLGLTAPNISVSAVNQRFLPWVWTAVLVLLVTGTILIIAEPRRDLINNVFRLKMVLLISVAALTLGFQETVRRNAEAWGVTPSHRLSARLLAFATLTAWIGIMICGRWIAYVDHG